MMHCEIIHPLQFSGHLLFHCYFCFQWSFCNEMKQCFILGHRDIWSLCLGHPLCPSLLFDHNLKEGRGEVFSLPLPLLWKRGKRRKVFSFIEYMWDDLKWSYGVVKKHELQVHCAGSNIQAFIFFYESFRIIFSWPSLHCHTIDCNHKHPIKSDLKTAHRRKKVAKLTEKEQKSQLYFFVMSMYVKNYIIMFSI